MQSDPTSAVWSGRWEERAGRVLRRRGARACLVLFLLVLALLVRGWDIHYRSLVMDEARQAMYGTLGPFDPRIVTLAATQPQPPLDYYLEAAGMRIFGRTEFGLRAHAVLLGSFAALFFFLYLWSYYSLRSAALGYLLFLFNPWLLRYSVEGRPPTCGVFAAVLFLWAFHALIKYSSLPRAVLLAGAVFLSLVSIGFQPFVLLAVFFLFTTVALAIVRPAWWWRTLLFLGVAYAIGGALFLPFHLQIARYSSALYRHGSELLFHALRLPLAFKPHDYLVSYDLFPYIRWLLPVCALGTLLMWWRTRSLAAQSHANVIRLTIAGVVAFFPFVVWYVFYLFVTATTLRYRYWITFIPAGILLLILGTRDLLRLCSAVKGRLWRGVSLVPLVAVVLTLVMTVATSRAVSRGLDVYPYSWRDFYRTIEEKVNPGDVMIIDTLIDGGWKPDWFCAEYYFKKYADFVPMLSTADPQFVTKLRKIAALNIPRQKVFFTYYLGEGYEQPMRDPVNFSGPSYRHLDIPGLATIICAGPSQDLAGNVEAFYEHVLEIVPRKESTARMLRILTELYLYRGEVLKAAGALQRLEEVDTAQVYAAFVQDVHRGVSSLSRQKNPAQDVSATPE